MVLLESHAEAMRAEGPRGQLSYLLRKHLGESFENRGICDPLFQT
jgi:hypothetical protein